jgi:hypothetical protein
MMWKIGIVMVLAALFAVGGCKKKNPCQDIADKICKELGAEHEMCKHMKEELGKGVSDEDKKECEEQMKNIDEMIKMTKEAEKLVPGGGETPPAGGETPPPANP